MAGKDPYAGMPPGCLIRTTIWAGSATPGNGAATVTGTHVFTNITREARIRIVGGGGAGGGVTGAAASTRAGSGGGAGCYQEFRVLVTANGSMTYSVGSGGSGVVSGTGNAGGDTTTTVEGVLRRASGGGGGTPNTGAGISAQIGGPGGSVSAQSGDIDIPGAQGLPYIVVVNSGAANTGVSGAGANSPLGTGGSGFQLTSPGGTATGYGSGGGGGFETATANVAGGDGARGVLIIEEYS